MGVARSDGAVPAAGLCALPAFARKALDPRLRTDDERLVDDEAEPIDAVPCEADASPDDTPAAGRSRAFLDRARTHYGKARQGLDDLAKPRAAGQPLAPPLIGAPPPLE